MEKITATIFKEQWTGLNKVAIVDFFNNIGYQKFHFVEDDGKLLLYDEYSLIEKRTYIYGNKDFGIIRKTKEDIK